MAAMYFDASALVKRYVAEVGSAWVRRVVARPVQQVIYTAALTQRVMHHFARRYQVLRLTQTVVTQACVALERHPLRAYDAVQLACALTVRHLMQQRSLVPPLFVAADDVLLAAAATEGFVVDNPLLHP
jgi:hypothetical protein